MRVERAVQLPRGSERSTTILANAHVPVGCMEGINTGDDFEVCIDRLALVDIEMKNGRIVDIRPAGTSPLPAPASLLLPAALRSTHYVDLHGKMVLPTFVDLHTHIGENMAWFVRFGIHLCILVPSY